MTGGVKKIIAKFRDPNSVGDRTGGRRARRSSAPFHLSPDHLGVLYTVHSRLRTMNMSADRTLLQFQSQFEIIGMQSSCL